MAAQAFTHSRIYVGATTRCDRPRKLRLIRRMDLFTARVLMALGLVLPALMTFRFLPTSFVLVGLALASLVAGGVTALIRCGEIA